MASQVGIVPIISGLGAGLYLEYSLLVGYTLLLTNLGVGWIRQATLAESGRTRHLAHPQVAIVVLSALLGPLTAAVLVFSLDGTQALAFFCASALYSTTYCLHLHYLTGSQADLRPKMAISIETSRWIVVVPLLLGLMVWGRAGFTEVALVLSLANVASLLPTRLAMGSDRITTHRDLVSDFHFGFPVAVWLAISSALQYSDRFVISRLAGPESAAAYAATYDILMRGSSALIMPLIVAAHPLILAAASQGRREDLAGLYKHAAAYLIGGAAFAIGIGVAFSLVGERFVQNATTSLTATVALALTGVAWQAALVIHKPFEAARRTWTMVACLLACLVANIGANVVGLRVTHDPSVAAVNAFLTALAYGGIMALLSRLHLSQRATT